MQKKLLYNPRLLCERLAELSIKHRRLAKLRGTVAHQLKEGHIDSLELLELLCQQNLEIIYDIGANVGMWTLLAKAIYPGAAIHAFEPLVKHQMAFYQNTKALLNVKLHGVALGSSPGSAMVKVTDFSDASSLLELTDEGKNRFHLNQVTEEQVTIETLDGWVQKNKLPWPDLIKMDVQGFELEVLRGAGEALTNAKAVLAEVSFREFYKGQSLFHQLASYLAERGFKLHAFGHGLSTGSPLMQADALFVSVGVLG